MYKKVAPTVKEKVTIIVPNHLPNKKPPTRNIGLPNPSRTTQIIVNKIKNIHRRILKIFGHDFLSHEKNHRIKLKIRFQINQFISSITKKYLLSGSDFAFSQKE